MDDNPPTWTNPRGPMPTLLEGVSLRLYTPGDYETLRTWWDARGVPSIPSKMLPVALSVFADWRGEPGAFAALYVDAGGTGFGSIQRVTTSPLIRRAAAACVSSLIKWLLWRSGEDDLRCEYVAATCHQASLAKIFARSGFIDGGLTHQLFA